MNSFCLSVTFSIHKRHSHNNFSFSAFLVFSIVFVLFFSSIDSDFICAFFFIYAFPLCSLYRLLSIALPFLFAIFSILHCQYFIGIYFLVNIHGIITIERRSKNNQMENKHEKQLLPKESGKKKIDFVCAVYYFFFRLCIDFCDQ